MRFAINFSRGTIVTAVALAVMAIGQTNETAPPARKKSRHLATPKAIECQSISWGHIQGGPTLIKADLPAGGTFKYVDFQIRPLPNGAWKTCQQGTMCDGVSLPKVDSATDQADGAPNYAAYVGPAQSGGSVVVFSGNIDVRLVVHYSTSLSSCLSQSTVEVAHRKASPVVLFVPPGHQIATFRTFVRDLGENKPWVTCDDWQTRVPQITNACRPVINFSTEHRDADADKSSGQYFSCEFALGAKLPAPVPKITVPGLHKLCRMQLEYQ